MREARIYIDGRPTIVDAHTYLRIKEAQVEACFLPECTECGQRAFLNDIVGASTGFRVVAGQVLDRGERAKEPGFSHFSGNNGIECSLYRPYDPRFQDLHRKNKPDSHEKERNLTVLNDPYTRRFISAVQTHFVRGLTGLVDISEKDRAELAKAEQKCISWTGLYRHPWVLGYMAPVFLGQRTREFEGKPTAICYEYLGEQRLAVQGSDGLESFLHTPQHIVAHKVLDGGRRTVPLLKGDKPIKFEVSAEAASAIVERFEERRRQTARNARGFVGQPRQLNLFTWA